MNSSNCDSAVADLKSQLNANVDATLNKGMSHYSISGGVVAFVYATTTAQIPHASIFHSLSRKLQMLVDFMCPEHGGFGVKWQRVI
jgi:hypothetical protein